MPLVPRSVAMSFRCVLQSTALARLAPARAAATVCVFTTVLLTAWDVVRTTSSLDAQSAFQQDCDLALIKDGASRVVTWRDTWRWWHGPWIGQVPFWRPLTSYMFWLQIRCFGTDSFHGYAAVSALLVLLSAGVIYDFARQLTGSWKAALLAVYWYAGYRPGRIGSIFPSARGPAVVVATYWKDQPDIVVVICLLVSLTMAMRRRLWASLAFVSLAVCFKESGWLGFVLVPLLMVCVSGVRWLRGLSPELIATSAFVIGALLALRYLSGPDVFGGFRMGTNRWWYIRYVHATAGYWPCLAWNCLPAAIGSLGLAVSIWMPCSLLTRMVVLLAGLAMAAGTQAARLDIPIAYAVAQLFELVGTFSLQTVLLGGLWLLLASLLLLWAWRQATCLALLSFVAALPYVAATQCGEHVLLLCYTFHAVIAALTIEALLSNIVRLARYRPSQNVLTANREPCV